jgi:hypothetical protein
MGPVLSKSELAQTEPAERAAFEASFRSSMWGIGVVFRSLLTASEIQNLRPHEVCGGALRVFKLADEHPLTNAGLRCVRVVEKAELGLRPGDIVFEFPFGRIVDTGMACRRDGIIPLRSTS